MAYKSIFNWSGGKDSALALYQVLQDENYKVGRLLTNVNTINNRVAMHGVRIELLQQQAIALGLPLQMLTLPDQPSMLEYNEAMATTIKGLQQEGFTNAIFGDIFLEDLRKYREDTLLQVGFTAHFPLWKKDTKKLIHEFINLGFKTIVCCVKSDVLDESFVGRIIDNDFLNDLPKNVDSCGENGEFHTFVVDGPIFK
ncbi:MAG: diphthine--ammonia ligase, partial [Deinococcales bacterium]|nr:diphthine--ammonia ligase [Chitinophagaceae bacterium]